jgi:hypothetical protein
MRTQNTLQVMVIESKLLELIPARYADTVMESSQRLSHWETVELSHEDYEHYEELRLELDELIDSARFPKVDCPAHGGNYDCTAFCPLCEGEQELAKR